MLYRKRNLEAFFEFLEYVLNLPPKLLRRLFLYPILHLSMLFPLVAMLNGRDPIFQKNLTINLGEINTKLFFS